MLTIFLLALMSQAQRNDIEFTMQQTLVAQSERIADIWHPSKRLLSDYRNAEKCYTKFHLGKTDSCADQLNRVRADLSEAR